MAALKKQHARRPEQYVIKEMMMKDLSEISPAVKSRYIHKANIEISNLEKAKDQAHKDMGKASASVEKHMDKTNQIVSSHGFFDDEKNYTLYESQRDRSKYCKPTTPNLRSTSVFPSRE